MVQEFQGKVIKAAQKLQQQLLDSADQPVSSTVQQSERMDTIDGVASAEQPGVPRNFDINDFKLARRRQGAWYREQAKLRRLADQPHKKRFQDAFALLQDCRKYNESNWIVDDEDKHMKKLLRQLEILALPHFTSKAGRELYNLTGRNSTLGPFVRRNDHGNQVEQDLGHSDRQLRLITAEAGGLPPPRPWRCPWGGCAPPHPPNSRPSASMPHK